MKKLSKVLFLAVMMSLFAQTAFADELPKRYVPPPGTWMATTRDTKGRYNPRLNTINLDETLQKDAYVQVVAKPDGTYYDWYTNNIRVEYLSDIIIFADGRIIPIYEIRWVNLRHLRQLFRE